MLKKQAVCTMLAVTAMTGATGMAASAHASEPAPAAHAVSADGSPEARPGMFYPIRCSITASRPVHSGPTVSATGKLQCSERVRTMDLIIELKRPDGHIERDEPNRVKNTSVFGFTTSTGYAGRGEYQITAWGAAVPYDHQDNGLRASDINYASL